MATATGKLRVLVLGRGVSGEAAAALVVAEGGEACVLGDDRSEALPEGDFDLAVVSPGVPPISPWFAQAAARHLRVVSELQFGCEALRRRGWRLLAVTGSKGKSSVVKLVAEALAHAGGAAVACGNYGLPVSAVALQAVPATRSAWAVVEVSSFMLETTTLAGDAFVAAALLNLQDDHLDRHGTREHYHALKRRLLAMTPQPVDASGEFPFADSPAVRTLVKGTYFDNPILSLNAAAGIRLLQLAGVDAGAIAAALGTFHPLPHRLEVVGEIGGVKYVDDSKATSLAALAAALLMVSPPSGAENASFVRLIAGGLGKGDDPKVAIAPLTKRVKKVYLIGSNALGLAAAWQAYVDCEVCGTLERAVAKARSEAVFGETVLLSPGAASYDQFRSFGERGDAFAGLVKQEGKK